MPHSLLRYLQVVFQIGDIAGLLTGKAKGSTLYGASRWEYATVVLGKLAHYAVLWVVPLWRVGSVSLPLVGAFADLGAWASGVGTAWGAVRVAVAGAVMGGGGVGALGEAAGSLGRALGSGGAGLGWISGGAWGAVIAGGLAYTAAQGIVLAVTFAVSHNLAENKPAAAPLGDSSGGAAAGRAQTAAAAGSLGIDHVADAGAVAAGGVDPTSAARHSSLVAASAADVSALLADDPVERDWGVQQILTSSNWGGSVGNFFTGGLNLQIEHHLFPAVAFTHYPAISRIVRDECEKRGVPYVHHDTLPQIVGRYCEYMRAVGREDAPPVAALTAYSKKLALARF